MRTPVTIGVVGGTGWSRQVQQVIADVPGAEILWVRNEARPGRSDGAFRNELVGLLDDDALDAVVVASSDGTRGRLAGLALEADKHVLVQSPVAGSSREAWELARKAGRRHCVLMEGAATAFRPALVSLKQLIDDGALGEVYYAYGNRQTFAPEDDPLRAYGGQILSALLYLFDDQPIEATARGESYLQPDRLDVVFAHLRFATGITAHLQLSRLDPHHVSRLTVVGSRAMAVLDDFETERRLTIHEKAVGAVAGAGAIISPFVSREDPVRSECERFVSAVRSPFARRGAAPAPVVLEILEALDRSVARGGAPEGLVAAVTALPEPVTLAVAAPEAL